MATRKIIDIEQNGEKVWPKGHAKATYMSDGRTVEDAINDIPSSGGGGEGESGVYITDFTVNDLEYIHDNPYGGIQFNIPSLYAAFASHKVVLVPYGDGSAGYGIATGYKDDFLYVSIMLEYGRRISLEIPNIDDNVIYPENISITTLAFEDNLKTINGQSIVGSGNIEISGGEGGGSSNGRNLVSRVDLIFSEGDPLLPDTTYYCNDVVAIDISAVTPPSGDYAEYTLLFKTDEDVYITCPDNWLWANGQAPSVEGDTVYELSVVATKFGSDYIYKAVLTPFKPAE